MPVIKARTRGKHIVRHITRLDRENYETLFAYAAFLGEPHEYVLNQLVDTVLAKDKEFLAWREAHPDVLGEPRALARLLCGLSSPRLAQAKLTKEALFGALAEVPFPDVLAWAESAGG